MAPRTVKAAFFYLRVLMMLEVLLFGASLLVHLSVLFGTERLYINCGDVLFRGSVFIGISVVAFANDVRWRQQIKTCPSWMWKGALGLGIYSLIAFVQVILSQHKASSDPTFAFSAIPLAFDAIGICVIYSVVAQSVVTSELIKRTLQSVLVLAALGIMFCLSRTTLLHTLTK
jgi:hypothetical protein